MSGFRRTIFIGVLACSQLAWAQDQAAPSATPAADATQVQLHVASAQLRAEPKADAATIALLDQSSRMSLAGQQGTWFRVRVDADIEGFVRVHEVRIPSASEESAQHGFNALMTGQAGRGRVVETAGVRGVDESSLRAAARSQRRLRTIESFRIGADEAAAYAESAGLNAQPGFHLTQAARGSMLARLDPTHRARQRAPAQPARPPRATAETDDNPFVRMGRDFRKELRKGMGDLAPIMGLTEDEYLEEELKLGPELASRLVAALPPLEDASVQRRVNLIGRWLADHGPRRDLPWTFAVVRSDEMNAFAAPGGYVFMTDALYNLLVDDDEVAAVLAHEISHVVERDHFQVIRKQAIAQGAILVVATQTGAIRQGRGSIRIGDYLTGHGATAMLARLDRTAEYRADFNATELMVRAGYDPIAMYGVLHKLSLAASIPNLITQLYRTHPPVSTRISKIDEVLEQLLPVAGADLEQ